MPQAVVWAVGYLAEYSIISAATAVAIGTFAVTYGAAIMLIGGLAYSSMKASQAREDARNQYNAAQVDRLVNVNSTLAPRELVLGRVRKGGQIFYKGSSGPLQKDLYLAIALAGHEIDAIETIYVNDVAVTLDGSGNATDAPYYTPTTLTGTLSTGAGTTATLPANYVTGTATASYYDFTSDYARSESTTCTVTGLIATAGQVNSTISYQYLEISSNVKVTKYLGAAGQAVDPDLLAAFPADWSSANTVQGIAYMVVRLGYSETSFPSGVPNITAVIRGAKVLDPRTGTTAWSENPALLMRHVYTHTKFGKAVVTADEEARFITAANACDTSTVYSIDNVAQASRALYKASVVLPFGTPASGALDDLAQAMGGSWAFAGGSLYLKAGVWGAGSVMSLTEADLAVVVNTGGSESQNPIKIGVHKERAGKFNTVKAKIWDAAQDYKQVDLTPLTATTLVDRDGAELVQEVSYPAIGYAPQALHVAGIMMRDARDPLVIELPVKLRAYPIELFDTVDLTLTRYGWTAKTFMVLGRAWNADGSLALTLKESTAAIFTKDASFKAQGWAANTNLPKPWEIGTVGAITCTSGTAELIRQADGTVQSRMRVSWAAATDMAVLQGGKIEVQYRLASNLTGEWAVLMVDGNDTSIATTNVIDNNAYIVRARLRTPLAIGDWNTQAVHTVVGKAALPGNVTGLTATGSEAGVLISWAACAEADYAYTLIKQTNWSGAELYRGAGSSFLWVRPASASYAFAVKHVDTSGNESDLYATCSVTYIQPAINNTMITVNPDGSLDNAGSGAPSLGSIAGAVGTAKIAQLAVSEFVSTHAASVASAGYEPYYSQGNYSMVPYYNPADTHASVALLGLRGGDQVVVRTNYKVHIGGGLTSTWTAFHRGATELFFKENFTDRGLLFFEYIDTITVAGDYTYRMQFVGDVAPAIYTLGPIDFSAQVFKR